MITSWEIIMLSTLGCVLCLRNLSNGAKTGVFRHGKTRFLFSYFHSDSGGGPGSLPVKDEEDFYLKEVKVPDGKESFRGLQTDFPCLGKKWVVVYIHCLLYLLSETMEVYTSMVRGQCFVLSSCMLTTPTGMGARPRRDLASGLVKPSNYPLLISPYSHLSLWWFLEGRAIFGPLSTRGFIPTRTWGLRPGHCWILDQGLHGF